MRDFVSEIQNLRRLNGSDTKLSPGTPGCFLKAYEEQGGRRFYYKLSNYDSYRGVFGHECINELIVSRLMEILQIEHLSYDLHRREKESPLEFFVRIGWEKYVYQMLLVDYLICNRDRHGANIEILIDSKGNVRPSPFFDQGLSPLFSTYGDMKSIAKYDVMEDKAVNNFVGSQSAEYNLCLIPEGKWVEGILTAEDRGRLLDGLRHPESRSGNHRIFRHTVNIQTL